MVGSDQQQSKIGKPGFLAGLPILNRILLISGCALALGGLILKLDNVFTAPINIDTNFYLNTGSNFIERGGLTPYMWRMDPTWNFVGNGSGYGIVPLLVWLKTFGLSINSGHIFMYLAGLATLPFIYLFVSAWYGQESGWWAVIFAALCGPFLESYYVRMDAPAEFWYCVILFLYCYAARQNRMIWHALLGVMLIVSVEFHGLTFLYVGALSFMYGVDYVMAAIQKRRLWIMTPTLYFGVGLAVSLVVYVVIHILPNPDIFFLIPRSCKYCVGVGPLKEFARYAVLAVDYPVETTIFVVSIVIALLRREKADRRYLLLVAGILLSMAVLNPPISIEYTGHIYPVIALGAGSLVVIPARVRSVKALPFRQIVQLLLMVLMLGLQLRTKSQMPPRLPAMGNPTDAAAVAYIREHIPHDTVIMGPPSIFSDLLDFPQYLEYKDDSGFGVEIRHETYLTLWKREQPQAFVGQAQDDAELMSYMRSEGGFDEVQPGLWVSKSLIK